MSAINDGGPAFPAHHFDLAENERGMSLRDYFAANVLPSVYAVACQEFEKSGWVPPDWRIGIAIDAYKLADAMLAARAKSTGGAA